MKNLIFIGFVFLSFCAANTNSENKKAEDNNKTKIQSAGDKVIQTGFLDSVPVLGLPYQDTIYWELEGTPALNEDMKEKLRFNEVSNFEWGYSSGEFHMLGKFHISEDFHSLLVNLIVGLESKNVLINYTKNLEIIDFVQTAYDETAEGWFYSSSMIYKDKIIIEKYDGTGGGPEEEVIEFKILVSGEIIE